MSSQEGQLINDILNLKNDAMAVNQVEKNMFDFKSHTESKGWLGKVGVSFSGRVCLDADKQSITYWDMIKKSSAGMGGIDMGFSSDVSIVKGRERSGTGGGVVPGGEPYRYDYGKVRAQVKAIAEKNGWSFRVVLIKPKWWKGLFG